jgi:DNA-binding NarL/FixJ family response regulator
MTSWSWARQRTGSTRCDWPRSSIEAITLIRAEPDPPTILVHSGFDADTMRERVLALGAAAYLEKGGNLGEVRQAVRQLVERPTS